MDRRDHGREFHSLLWLIIDVYRGGPDGNEHLVWDETLREGARPAPIWWFWFILALMTISVVYVMLYPGLGTYRGALGWSMGGRIEERFVDYEGQFGTQRRLVLKTAARRARQTATRPCAPPGTCSTTTAVPATATMPPARRGCFRT